MVRKVFPHLMCRVGCWIDQFGPPPRGMRGLDIGGEVIEEEQVTRRKAGRFLKGPIDGRVRFHDPKQVRGVWVVDTLHDPLPWVGPMRMAGVAQDSGGYALPVQRIDQRRHPGILLDDVRLVRGSNRFRCQQASRTRRGTLEELIAANVTSFILLTQVKCGRAAWNPGTPARFIP